MSRFEVAQPAAPESNPYLPKGPPDPLLFEQFDGINTQTTRPGVDDKQMAWSDGWMPVAPRKLRTLPDVGAPISFTDTATVSFFGFANIGSTPYCIAILADGSVYAVNTTTFVRTSIAPSGTITNASRLNVGLSQYGARYVMIVSTQTNGYFLWDGSILYKAGGIAPGVTITAGGTGYTSVPAVALSGGSGSGATFLANLSGGIVTSITVLNPGTGYLAGDVVTVVISSGGGSGATATITLMPYAVSGSAIEVYAGRVWIANGAVITFSAPGSVSDFSSANGGGNFTSSDSFLRVHYIQLIQTNGFLYLIADSSINYISGVQTSGSPAVTTFTNQNADPEVGTPWPSTVNTFSRNILFANAFGAHVSYGASVNKISDMLDGVYNTVPNFGGIIPSSAKAIIFGKRVWLLLLPIIDPISGQQVNKIFMWDSKRWWSSSQGVPLFYIQNQEIDSVLTAWGTNGTSIYPLFQTPSTAFAKVVQTKLWDRPGGYQFIKNPSRLWGIFQYYNPLEPDLVVSIDNEGSAAGPSTPVYMTANWTTASGAAANWTTASSAAATWQAVGGSEASAGDATYTVSSPVQVNWTTFTGEAANWTTADGSPAIWQAAGIGVIEPVAIGQTGVLTGFTATTFCADMAIISMMLGEQIGATRS